MTSSSTSDSGDDLSALAWVHDELRRSLEVAHKSLRRFVKEAEAVGGSDIDAVDPAVLRAARSQIHQGVGALELVGLPAAASVLRASEALVQRVVAKPHRLTSEVIDVIERASFGLLDYLTRLLAGKNVSPLALFPQYRAVQEAAGAERVHPADLWSVDWQWRDLPADPTGVPRQADAATRGALEGQLLTLMKTPTPAVPAARMSEICAGLGAGAVQPQIATFWKLASAVFEAQSQGLLGFDVFSKRVASRLLAQFRILERGETEVSERLAQDLLFFCAQSASPGDGRKAPRLAAIRLAYGLAHYIPADYAASPLGRFDPAVIIQAKKRVAAAKEAWSAVAGGEMHRLTGLSEQFALVGESLKRLFPLGDIFSAELQQAVLQTQQAVAAPPAPLAMEVATSLLYIEAALEDADFDHPDQAERVQRLADRLHGVRQGRAPDPLEGWMEELYRRVSDRQTMGSVVQELRASLSEAEKSIDQFFRNPTDHNVLIPVPNQLSAMRGVLSVLGMDHASAALLRMRDEVDGLITTEIEPQHVTQAGVFDRLAGNLGALGFLIDMLSVQPQMAKSLFSYDAEAGTLSPVMGREAQAPAGNPSSTPSAPVEQRLIEQAQSLAFSSVRQDVSVETVSRDLERLSHEALAADQPSLAATVRKAREAIDSADNEAGVSAARGELSEALVDFVATANEPVGLDEPAPPAEAKDSLLTLNFAGSSFGAAPAEQVDSGLGEDDEMREVFLEEAREVLADATQARADLEDSPDDLSLLTTLRRAFHTLKGSSRMVGLKEFGEAAWACEQLYNTHLADQKPAGPPLLDFTAWCLGYLTDWVEDIAARRASAHDAHTVKTAADMVTHGDTATRPAPLPSPSPAPMPAPVPEPMLLGFPPDLPTAADLDLSAPRPAESRELPAVGELKFEFDLSGLDTPFDAQEHAVSAPMPLDMTAAPLLEPFDTQATEPAPLDEATDESSPAEVPAGVATEPEFSLDVAEFDLPEVSEVPAPEAAPEPAPAAEHEFQPEPATAAEPEHEDEQVKVVGPLRISIPLFNIYLNEADELSRRLSTEVAEWAMELHRPIGETPVALAHSLAGSSATVGFADLSHLARSLEHAQARSQAIGHGTQEEGELFVDAADEIRRLLHQFAAGFLKEPSPELLARLADHERSSALRLEAATAAAELPPVSESGALVDANEPALDLITLDPDEAPSDVHAHELAEAEPADAEPPTTVAAALDLLEPGEAVEAIEAPEAEEEFPEDLEATVAWARPARAADAHDEAPETDTPPDTVPADLEPVEGQADSGARPVHAELPETAEQVEAAAEPEVAVDDLQIELRSDLPGAAEVEVHPPTDSSSSPAETGVSVTPTDTGFVSADTQFGISPTRFGLTEFKPFGDLPAEPMRAAAGSHELVDADESIDAVDAIDEELFPIFSEEAEELLPQLSSRLRDWLRKPNEAAHPAACMRTLHTLKGGARLAGAMRLGEMAHRLETRIERLLANPPVEAVDVERLQNHGDALSQTFEALSRGDLQAQSDAEQSFARSTRPAPLESIPEVAPVAAPPTTQEFEAASQEPEALAPEAEVALSEVDAAPIDAAPIDAAPEPAPPASVNTVDPSVDASVDAGPDTEADQGTLEAEIAIAAADLSVIEAPAPVQPAAELPPIDWSRFSSGEVAPRKAPDRASAQSSVRVRAPVLDRLVNQAGEVSITRSRIETGVAQIKGSLADLTENLDRLRAQLRDIEFHGEVQMTSRMEAAKAAAQSFDPLEFDRFTRFQELTRMMAESVNDVATVQRTVQRALENTEDELVAQARLTRDLQDDLLRTRMVEFEGLSDRLYRVVRQAAKETGKSVRLDIVGGGVEVDRGVLDRMTGSFEHLLRNSVTHGIEKPDQRTAAGKDATGSVIVALSQEGNEVGVEFRDDGAGLNLQRIREKGIALGMLESTAEPTDAELANLIFMPGFTTAEGVTELAGRGVGMDVVRSDVNAMGGRVETSTSAGQGTSFKLILPLTTAVTQVVMLRCGETRVAVPSTLVEAVRRATPAEVDQAYASGGFVLSGSVIDEKPLPFFWLGALLQISARPADSTARTRMVVVIRSAQQRIALHVDEVLGNQEVVVKNLGPQLSRMPGLAGVTLLASGTVALIYNPVALATLYGESARAATHAALNSSTARDAEPVIPLTPDVVLAPLVMVVDDSLTVRRVTQRLLLREGYRVVLAKDGLDALERLAEEVPQIVLSDIEMPRMDGFDLVRNMRADARLRELPVVMITSRIAQKHRDYAAELGVDHYLGKPYAEEDLLGLVSRYTTQRRKDQPADLTTA